MILFQGPGQMKYGDDTEFQNRFIHDCVQAVHGVPRVGTTRDVGIQGLQVYLTSN